MREGGVSCGEGWRVRGTIQVQSKGCRWAAEGLWMGTPTTLAVRGQGARTAVAPRDSNTLDRAAVIVRDGRTQRSHATTPVADSAHTARRPCAVAWRPCGVRGVYAATVRRAMSQRRAPWNGCAVFSSGASVRAVWCERVRHPTTRAHATAPFCRGVAPEGWLGRVRGMGALHSFGG